MSEGIKRNLPNNQYKAAINAENPTANNPFVTQAKADDLQQQIDLIVGDQSSQLYSGSAVWTGTGYVYEVTNASYKILGVNYTAAATQVTLSAADPTNDRLDVIYADVNGNIGVIEGTAEANPVKPTIDPTTQIEITFIKVTSGTTAPPGQALETVYDENVEWTTTGQNVFGVVDFVSTEQVYQGSVSTKVTNFGGNVGDYLEFTTGVESTLPDNGNILIRLRIGEEWISSGKGLILYIVSGGFHIATAYIGGTTLTTFGFNPYLINQWQTVSIPLSYLGIQGRTVDNFRIIKYPNIYRYADVNFYLDAFQIEDSDNNGGNPPVTGLALGELSDVDFTTPPTDGQTIVYDLATDTWIPGAGGGGGASALDDLTDVTITTPTDGQVLTYDSASGEWINAASGSTDNNFEAITIDAANLDPNEVTTVNHTLNKAQYIVQLWDDVTGEIIVAKVNNRLANSVDIAFIGEVPQNNVTIMVSAGGNTTIDNPNKGAFNTINRPLATAINPGDYYFDLDLGYVLWSNGSQYVNVTGATE